MVTIFKYRTGHKRLLRHTYTKVKTDYTAMCSSKQAPHTAGHMLLDNIVPNLHQKVQSMRQHCTKPTSQRSSL